MSGNARPGEKRSLPAVLGNHPLPLCVTCVIGGFNPWSRGTAGSTGVAEIRIWFWGVAGPHLCRSHRTGNREPVAGAVNPLRPPCPQRLHPGRGGDHEGVFQPIMWNAGPREPPARFRPPELLSISWNGGRWFWVSTRHITVRTTGSTPASLRSLASPPCPSASSMVSTVGRGHRRERGGRRGSPIDCHGSTPRAPRSRFILGGWTGGPPCRCPPSETGNLSWTP